MRDIDWSKAPKWATEVGQNTDYAWLCDDGYCYQGIPNPPCHPFGNGNQLRESFTVIARRPWTGEGLPPVGAICEHSDLIVGEEWTEVEIVAHRTFDGDDYPCAVFVYRAGSSHSSEGDHFRPRRNPDQIAADNRDKAIREMAQIPRPCGYALYKVCADLYDAGYRKQED